MQTEVKKIVRERERERERKRERESETPGGSRSEN